MVSKMKHTEAFLDNYKGRMEHEDSFALGLELMFITILDLAVNKDKAMEVAA